MFDRDIWQEIFHTLKNNKLRTFLTGFSVGWAIFILVMLLASVNGMQNGFTNQFNDDATNTIFVRPGTTSKAYAGFEKDRRIQFENDDYQYIKQSFPKEIEQISARYFANTNARYKSETGSYPFQGVHADFQVIEKTIITKGRYFNNIDVLNKAKVAIIGRKVKEDLFNKEDAVGKFVEFNGLPFRIIGIFTDEGDDNAERRIYAPITTLQRNYGNTNNINQIALTYNSSYDLTEALEFSQRLEDIMKRRHKISPEDQAGINVWNYAEAFDNISSFSSVLNAISIGVGFLILIAGIVGIGNIMVFTIKERTKEIGVRKALGAMPKQIINLVLLESTFITALSGFIGLIFAWIILSLIGPTINTPAFSNPSVSLSTVITATIILIVAGVLAGLIPAIKAANVKPIVALSDK
ncbi:ABC transporter ATP-binding protein [Flagellimonas aquimarina]|jgi:putative ABC transport system permease protein|uniref:ABC transporter ATP-binding protein n=1 Tax=Flagellimonas aquimarina TaxID=2201895 RepID=A0A316L2U7_9FLAO|nr:ABC transporter permease [Allomuricauda koreensis]PWL39275.1 ABC transporter ATP-binding protein [Allomuricauda koreensis]